MANIRSLDGDGDVDIIGGSRTSTGATKISYAAWHAECSNTNSCGTDSWDENGGCSCEGEYPWCERANSCDSDNWDENGGSIGFLVYWENTSGNNTGQCLDLY